MKTAIFLGTPHRGSALASALQALLKWSTTPNSFLQQLRPSVDEIFREFNELEAAKIAVSFYESRGMGPFNHVLSQPYDPY